MTNTLVPARLRGLSRMVMPFSLILLAFAVPLVGGEEAADEIDLGSYYGFAPLEVFKLQNRSESMVSGDLNGDGRLDLALIDNSHSRIDLLIQRASKPDLETVTSDRRVNTVDSHWRFDHQKLPVDREIAALALGDFNSDSNTDIAYFARPDQLVIRFQSDEDPWSERWETRLADVSGGAWSIACGDFNHDGRDDLVVLGDQNTYLLLQEESGGFDTVRAIRNTADSLRLAMAADLDGDGRDDLFYTANSPDGRQICVRLQTAQGTLGPEYRLEINDPFGVTVADIDGDSVKEILAINSKTKRVSVNRIHRPQASEDQPENRPILYGIGVKGAGSREFAIGDIDGDGLVDVVVSDPESAQLIAYRQHKEGGLDLGTPYASYLGVEQLRMADLDHDGRAEIVVFSPKEKTLGVCRFEDGRVTFPRALPIEDDFSAFEIADLNGDSVTEIVYITREKQGRSSATLLLKAISYPAEGDPRPYIFGEDQTQVEIQTDARDADKLTLVDANLDGRPDLWITTKLGRTPQLLVTDKQGIPRAQSGSGGVQISDLRSGAIFSRPGPEGLLLISQGNFTRRMKLDDDGRWEVLDQYNATGSGARITGTAMLDVDGEEGEEIVLVDSGVGKLRIYRLSEEVYQPWRQIDLPSFDYQSLEVADLNGDGRKDLLLFGGSRFAVLYMGQTDPRIEELASFEPDREDAFPVDLAAGDLNGDGRADLAVIDNANHSIDLVAVLPGPALKGALHFKVFESKSFRGGGADGMQPREIHIADVTGDGRDDLLLLAHDRLLLYPQDPGTAQETETTAAAEAGE